MGLRQGLVPALRIFVDDRERIVSWTVTGNQGACSTFAWWLSD